MLLPALSKAKEKGRQINCLNNVKQLQTAWHLYIDDSNNWVAENRTDMSGPAAAGLSNSWVIGNAVRSTNLADIQNGTIFRYTPNVRVYRCPSDRSTIYQSNEPRLRSYSMDGYLNGLPNSISKFSEIRFPAQIFVFLDEHEETIDGGTYAIDRSPTVRWFNLPADRHTQGGNLSFADGHSLHLRWRAPKKFITQPQAPANAEDLADLQWLQAGLPPPP